MDSKRNWPPAPHVTSLETITPDDIEADLQDAEPGLLKYFRLLPKELWVRHYKVVEKIAEEASEDTLVAEQRMGYMEMVTEAREKAIIEYFASDEALRAAWEGTSGIQESLATKLREAFVENGNLLGAGTTARVKRVQMEGVESPIAIKYLLAPTAKTLSVDAEHDMLREVETITQIEAAENRRGVGKHMGVPHPYFFYKRGKFQCYGMEEVQGVTLEAILTEAPSQIQLQDTILAALRERFSTEESRQELWQEIEDFVNAMHEVCLHGDVKDKNIMVDAKGRFYLIDFGQSVSMDVMSEKTRGQFDELRDEEHRAMLDRIRNIVRIATAGSLTEAA